MTVPSARSGDAGLSSTRHRIVAEAMRLFGRQGYPATTIAQIESAAGLRPGSGGLYRHFTSKRELLEAGVREQLVAASDLFGFIADPAGMAELPLRDRLTTIGRAALARLRSERDLNRIIVRDLEDFPELLELVRTTEMVPIQTMLADWLRGQASSSAELDWDATAVVLMGSVSHYWLLEDAMGGHPSRLDEDRFLDALADLVATFLDPGGAG